MQSRTADRRGRVRTWLGSAALVAVVATAGSLWFSLGLGLVPCELCWYQRVLMYPLVVVLSVAAVDARASVWKTALPLSGLGVVVAGYHSWLQATTTTCSFGGPCAVVQWRLPVLGLTVPNLSFVAFLLVAGAVVAASTAPFRDSDG
ncbi:MAG: disulfide bond formation protein B [Haloplanus sp.]